MEALELATPYKRAQYDELNVADRELIDAARAATLRSYAPYSHFSVGAALRLDNGQVVTGSNQENAAYPSGTCAERTTCYYAHSQYPDAKFDTIAIAARDTDGQEIMDPISPCGACRQAMVEYEHLAGQKVRVLLVGRRCIYVLPSLASLLPFTFTSFK